MLYVLYGSDTDTAREKMHALVASLIKREPNASQFRLDAETCTTDALAEYIGAQGLFASRVLVVMDRVLESEEVKTLILARIQDIASSDNIFVILEGALDAKTCTKLEKYAEKIQEYSLRTTDNKPQTSFNIFALTDALGNRDRGKLWTLYQRALRTGVSPEEIHGVLFWQLKTLLQVAEGDTTGLKPFVVGKAKRFLAHYSLGEVRGLVSRFVSLYHNARRGAVEFDIGLERFLLSL